MSPIVARVVALVADALKLLAAGAYASAAAGLRQAANQLDELVVQPEWCPVCHSFHAEPGEKTDRGKLTRQCPQLPADDPRNVFANYPGR